MRQCRFSTGHQVGFKTWDQAAILLFTHVVDGVRAGFIEDAKDPTKFIGEVLVGSRVMSNEMVLICLQSNCTIEEFKAEPLSLTYEALHCCAERDWWYAHEKRWT